MLVDKGYTSRGGGIYIRENRCCIETNIGVCLTTMAKDIKKAWSPQWELSTLLMLLESRVTSTYTHRLSTVKREYGRKSSLKATASKHDNRHCFPNSEATGPIKAPDMVVHTTVGHQQVVNCRLGALLRCLRAVRKVIFDI